MRADVQLDRFKISRTLCVLRVSRSRENTLSYAEFTRFYPFILKKISAKTPLSFSWYFICTFLLTAHCWCVCLCLTIHCMLSACVDPTLFIRLIYPQYWWVGQFIAITFKNTSMPHSAHTAAAAAQTIPSVKIAFMQIWWKHKKVHLFPPRKGNLCYLWIIKSSETKAQYGGSRRV